MLNSNKLKHLIVLVFFLFAGLCAWYSNDLQQVNSHEIFLSKSKLKNYRNFQKITNEKQVLVAKFNFSQEVSSEFFERLLNWKEKNIKLWIKENIEIITFENIYSTAARSDKFEDLKLFEKKYPGLIFPLMSDRSISVLVTMPSDVGPKRSENVSSYFIGEWKEFAKQNNAELHIAGVPYVNHLLGNYSKAIKIELFPLMFLVCALLVWLFLGHWAHALSIFFPALFATLFSLAGLKFLEGQMNMVTAILPLLTFVVNIAVGLHLYFGSRFGGGLKIAYRKKIGPIALMVFTTCVGLGSLATSSLEVVKVFGVLSALFVFLTTVLQLLWFWCINDFLYSIFPIKKENISRWKAYLLTWSIKKISRKWAYLVIIINLVAGVWCAKDLKMNLEAATYFPEKEKIWESLQDVYENLFGHPNFEIFVQRKDQEALSFSDFVIFQKLEEDLVSLLGDNTKVFSLNSFVGEINRIYSGEQKLPTHPAAYAVLRGKIPEAHRSSYQGDQFYRITLAGKMLTNEDYFYKRAKIEEILRSKYLNDYHVRPDGLYTALMDSQKDLIWVLGSGLGSSLVVILICTLIYFKSGPLLWAFFLANGVPLFATVVFMRVFNLSINAATVMTFSVALGMIVDSSYHIIHAHRHNDLGESYVQSTIAPIVYGNILLSIAFGLFGAYGFLPIREFGVSLAFSIFIGLLYDLYILPALITRNSVNHN